MPITSIETHASMQLPRNEKGQYGGVSMATTPRRGRNTSASSLAVTVPLSEAEAANLRSALGADAVRSVELQTIAQASRHTGQIELSEFESADIEVAAERAPLYWRIRPNILYNHSDRDIALHDRLLAMCSIAQLHTLRDGGSTTVSYEGTQYVIVGTHRPRDNYSLNTLRARLRERMRTHCRGYAEFDMYNFLASNENQRLRNAYDVPPEWFVSWVRTSMALNQAGYNTRGSYPVRIASESRSAAPAITGAASPPTAREVALTRHALRWRAVPNLLHAGCALSMAETLHALELCTTEQLLALNNGQRVSVVTNNESPSTQVTLYAPNRFAGAVRVLPDFPTLTDNLRNQLARLWHDIPAEVREQIIRTLTGVELADALALPTMWFHAWATEALTLLSPETPATETPMSATNNELLDELRRELLPCIRYNHYPMNAIVALRLLNACTATQLGALRRGDTVYVREPHGIGGETTTVINGTPIPDTITAHTRMCTIRMQDRHLGITTAIAARLLAGLNAAGLVAVRGMEENDFRLWMAQRLDSDPATREHLTVRDRVRLRMHSACSTVAGATREQLLECTHSGVLEELLALPRDEFRPRVQELIRLMDADEMEAVPSTRPRNRDRFRNEVRVELQNAFRIDAAEKRRTIKHEEPATCIASGDYGCDADDGLDGIADDDSNALRKAIRSGYQTIETACPHISLHTVRPIKGKGRVSMDEAELIRLVKSIESLDNNLAEARATLDTVRGDLHRTKAELAQANAETKTALESLKELEAKHEQVGFTVRSRTVRIRVPRKHD